MNQAFTGNAYSDLFGLGMAGIVADKEIAIAQSLSLRNFLEIDYRVSNPRLLSLDSEMKIRGNPYSQSTNANYFFGVAIFRNAIPNNDAGLIGQNSMSKIKQALQEKLVKALSYSAVPNISGLSSVFVGEVKELSEDNDVCFIPFMVSTVVFYNAVRATIGSRNDEKSLNEVLNSIKMNFDSNLEASLVALTPSETMSCENPLDLIDYLSCWVEDENWNVNKVISSMSDFINDVDSESFNGHWL